jgi:hypothetical protein
MTTTQTNQPTTTTTPDNQYWIAQGTTIELIRAREGNTATEIRAAWDYRAVGLTVDQAREEIARHCRRGAHRRARRQPGATTPSEGRIIALQINRRYARARRADEISRLTETPAQWLAWRPSWDAAWSSFPLPSGQYLRTERRERAEWGRKNGHYPTHTEVSYITTLLVSDGAHADRDRVVSHDGRGDWRTRVLVELGLVSQSLSDDRSDMPLRLSRSCEARDRHSLPDGTIIGERLLCGSRVDYYASSADRKTAFHAETVADAVAGLVRKQRVAAAAAAGELLTAQVAHERWGFCLPGLREFASATGLSVDGEYLLEDVRAVVTPDIRARFESDLALAGV